MATRSWGLMLAVCRVLIPPIARLLERGDALMERMLAAAEESRREREQRYIEIMRTASREPD